MLQQRLSLFALACLAAACAASSPIPDPQLLYDAEQLCLDARFAEAEPMLREYLRADPDNAVAHYYLGRCYLSGDLINIHIARGEFETALALFAEYGQKSPRDRFSDEYFELMCLTDIGKTYLSEIALTIPRMRPQSARIEATLDRLERCEALYARAEAINPDNHLTKWLRKHIDDVRTAIDGNAPRTVDW